MLQKITDTNRLRLEKVLSLTIPEDTRVRLSKIQVLVKESGALPQYEYKYLMEALRSLDPEGKSRVTWRDAEHDRLPQRLKNIAESDEASPENRAAAARFLANMREVNGTLSLRTQDYSKATSLAKLYTRKLRAAADARMTANAKQVEASSTKFREAVFLAHNGINNLDKVYAPVFHEDRRQVLHELIQCQDMLNALLKKIISDMVGASND